MEKVLIISYYWPPSGGAGVQRWVKLTKYLTQMGLRVFVVTVDEQYASYLQLDKSLNEDVATAVQVTKTKSFEIINWYAKIAGKSQVPTAGFSNVDNQTTKQKLINGIRSNFFIPDPRNGWNKYAYRAAKQLIQREGIRKVITTSPPHSTQLVGLKLKRELGVEWLVDLRDPWTDIYYYHLLNHSRFSHRINLSMETQVLLSADKVITVSQGLVELFLQKSDQLSPAKFHIIPNGYDEDDFKDRPAAADPSKDAFVITYTGTMSDQYEPEAFFRVLQQVISEEGEVPIRLRLVGNVSDNIKKNVETIGLQDHCEFVPPVPHDEITQYQMEAQVLLLIIPNIKDAKGILTGKLFEYLAARKLIFGLGESQGDAAAIVNRCAAGTLFERTDAKGMLNFLRQAIQRFKAGTLADNTNDQVQAYSRRAQAAQIKQLLLSGE